MHNSFISRSFLYKSTQKRRGGVREGGKIVPKPTKMGDKKVIENSDDNLKIDEDTEESAELPDWLPDGWIMDVYRANDGTINRYYTSPISGYVFTSKSDVLDFLFNGIDERILESKERSAESMFLREHEWLPMGWIVEVRAGGENMHKMYKFYVELQTGVRVLSKEDVLLYIKEKKIPECDTNGQCDTSSEDNILARLKFNPAGLPNGWVEEEAFRKTNEGIKRQKYYTDPITKKTFRSLKKAVSYLETGIVKQGMKQRINVHDLYSFGKSADLHESLRTRLKLDAKPNEKCSRSCQPSKTSKIKQYGNEDSSEDGDASMGDTEEE